MTPDYRYGWAIVVLLVIIIFLIVIEGVKIGWL